jgi:hypothetical protein
MPAPLLLNWNLYKSRTTSRVWCVNSICRGGVVIGVPRVITNLINSVIHQVLADRPSHIAGRPWDVASTNYRPRDPFHRLLESITAKKIHERLQCGADWPGCLAGSPPTGPTHQWPLHLASSCQGHSWVTLILVGFHISFVIF